MVAVFMSAVYCRSGFLSTIGKPPCAVPSLTGFCMGLATNGARDGWRCLADQAVHAQTIPLAAIVLGLSPLVDTDAIDFLVLSAALLTGHVAERTIGALTRRIPLCRMLTPLAASIYKVL